MSKPTPGPWTAHLCSEGYHNPPKWCIHASRRVTDDAERDANARLMTAAPELLQALVELVGEYVMLFPALMTGAQAQPVLKARAAIDKATGGDR